MSFIKNLALALVVSSLCISAASADSGTEKETYTIDPAQSLISVYTGKVGWASWLGHVHLVSITDIKGYGVRQGDNTYAELKLFPDDFLVDDNSYRSKQAEDAYKEPTSQSIAKSVRKHMLMDNYLDSKKFPEIDISIAPDHVISSTEDSGDVVFAVKIKVKDHVDSKLIQASVKKVGNSIIVSSEFDLSNAELGLTPPSFTNAIRVADVMHLKAYFVGVRADSR